MREPCGHDVPNLGRNSLLLSLALFVCIWLAAPAIALVVQPLGVAQHASAEPRRRRVADPEVLALLGEDVAHARRFDGLRVTGVEGVDDGAIRLDITLDAGDAFRVEILRRDPSGPTGVAETSSVSLFLIGARDARTPESHARAVRAIARRIAAQEMRGAIVPPLKTLRERHPR